MYKLSNFVPLFHTDIIQQQPFSITVGYNITLVITSVYRLISLKTRAHKNQTRVRNTSAQNSIRERKTILARERFCSTCTNAVPGARGCDPPYALATAQLLIMLTSGTSEVETEYRVAPPPPLIGHHLLVIANDRLAIWRTKSFPGGPLDKWGRCNAKYTYF